MSEVDTVKCPSSSTRPPVVNGLLSNPVRCDLNPLCGLSPVVNGLLSNPVRCDLNPLCRLSWPTGQRASDPWMTRHHHNHCTVTPHTTGQRASDPWMTRHHHNHCTVTPHTIYFLW
ncbi:hypothetical protein ACOMHN_041111 [Nucella lapillus]